MPSASARQVFEDQIPTFMSVFDLDAETMVDRDTVTVVNPQAVDMETKSSGLLGSSEHTFLRPSRNPSTSTHRHTDSNSTQMSESADSSPTTTMSTTDSSPLSDPSPSSSPDSPTNLIPLNNYPATTFGALPTQLSIPPVPTMSPPAPPPPSGGFERPMTSPAPRRPRNMKGLSIQPPSINTSANATTTMVSEPCSPAFIKPKIPAMKRKPSQLSLKTNTSDLMNRPTDIVPPSPGMAPMLQRRALKHSISTPHMFSGPQTSTFGPAGGMTFPKVLERNESGLSEVLRPMKVNINSHVDSTISEEDDSPIKSQVATRSDFESNPEIVNDEDQKSPGYPDGPIAIYGDNVYLYLEPTADEASRFDLVINVAREVLNPFENPNSKDITPPAVTASSSRHFPLSPVAESPCVESATTTASFATAFEFQPHDQPLDTPTTPKANPLKTPEYIHMLWDHNTDIAPDLLKLCEIIDNRTKEGKKVLIHCQQGASRSASLIIAYGLYQKPELSVNDAYYAAQSKSRWISPNMKLMYSLQDFQKEISQKRSNLSGSSRSRSGKSPTKHRLTMSADAIEVASKEPRTAPLPREGETDANGEYPGSRPRGNSTPTRPAITPGPASAPMNFAWGTTAQHQMELPPIKDPIPQSAVEFEPMDISSPIDGSKSFTFDALPKRPKSGQDVKRSPKQEADPWSLPPPTPGFGSFITSGFQSLTFPPIADVIPAPPSRAPPPPPPPPTLSMNSGIVKQTVTIGTNYADEDTLMSPRAETMTSNPFYEFPGRAGMRFTQQPPPPTGNLFSPRATLFPRDPLVPFGRPAQVADPRSPPTKGETPIVRSIDEFI